MSSNILPETILRMTAEQYNSLVERQIEAQDYIKNLKKYDGREYEQLSHVEKQRLALAITMKNTADRNEKTGRAISIVRDV